MEQIKAFLASTILALVIAPVVITILYQFKFRQKGKIEVDQLLEHRKETIGVPVMGGIIILIAVVPLYFLFSLQKTVGYIPIFIILSAGFVGFLDDYLDLFGKGKQIDSVVYSEVNPLIYKNFLTWTIYRYLSWPFRVFTNSIDELGSYRTGMRSSNKLFLEFVIAFVVSVAIHRPNQNTFLWIPFLSSINLEHGIIVLNTFVFMAFARAFSVTDGIDGLSAGTHTIAFLMLALLSYILGNKDLSLLAVIISGAEFAFYYFNIPPARVEMSDIGTIPLGMIFAFIGIQLNRTLALPLIGFIFVAEIGSSLLQTIFAVLFTKRLFKMAPIHHHFELMGWSREKIVMRFYFFTTVSALIGVLIAYYGR